MKNEMYDCLIIGAGPIALALARTLELRGLTFCLCGELPRQRPNSPDLRTAALFDGSIRLLERLGTWPFVEAVATPLDGIRIIDATGHLLRAPEQIFTAADIGQPHLGFNVPNPALVDGLRGTLGATNDMNRSDMGEINLTAQVRHVARNNDHVIATLVDGSVRRARVGIGADGRASITRAAAGIATRHWDHDQAAVTAHFEHALPSHSISTEIHTRAGPCTIVPMAANKASLVWMTKPTHAADLAACTDVAFITALEQRLDGLLGPIQTVSVRRVFPLSTFIAERFAANRMALVGESAHAFPPIGAQGLNLGLRDVAYLADHLADAAANGSDLGADSTLMAYSDSRRADVTMRTYGVDAFNVSLAGRAAGFLRGAILHTTKVSPDFRRFLMMRGLQPIGAWPSLMR